ncbi:MAG: YdcF family protein [Gammaproteobacteria bacterium]
MTAFTPNILRPAEDRDSLFVLGISMLVMAGSGGLLFLFLLLRVIAKARFASSESDCPESVFLVFGKRLNRNEPDGEYRQRLERLMKCRFESAILLGGTTRSSAISEARGGCDFLMRNGLDCENVHLEQFSQNTLENLKNARQLLNGRPTVIISSRYHLARCGALASGLGVSYRFCAAEDRFDLTPAIFGKCLIEAFYLHWFYCWKYWARVTGNDRMLDKIS